MHPPSPAPPTPGTPPVPLRGLALAAVLLTAAGLATLLAAALELGPLLRLDARLAVALHTVAHEHPALTDAQRVLTDRVWDPWTMRLLLVVAVGWLLCRRQVVRAVWVAATAAVGTGVQQGLKALVGRERPQWSEPLDSARYAAMPSGHALTVAVTAVLVVWVLHSLGCGPRVCRTAAVLGGLSTVGVAFTRLLLGVHWFSDTLAGALLGAGLALGCVAAAERLARRTAPCAEESNSGPTTSG